MRCEPVETRQKQWESGTGVEEYLFSGAYLLKRLTLAAGVKTPMHFHYAKTETLYVISGVVHIFWANKARPTVTLNPGDWFTIREGRKNAHRMIAGEDGAVYLEASTPHHDDSERVTAARTMRHYTYVGPEDHLRGQRALGILGDDDSFKVQVDDHAHPWSHGWNTADPSHWREDETRDPSD